MSETALDPGPVRDLLSGHGTSPRVATQPLTRQPVAAPPRAKHAAPLYVPPAGVRRGRLALLAVVATITYLADVLTKVAVVAFLDEGDPVRVGPTNVSLQLIRNPGAAFGFGVNATALITGITVAVVLTVLQCSRRLGSRQWALTLGLLLGGAAGNLTDRVARSPGFLSGQVVDFVAIPGWPVFNVADLSICLAGAGMVALACRNVPLDGRQCRRF